MIVVMELFASCETIGVSTESIVDIDKKWYGVWPFDLSHSIRQLTAEWFAASI